MVLYTVLCCLMHLVFIFVVVLSAVIFARGLTFRSPPLLYSSEPEVLWCPNSNRKCPDISDLDCFCFPCFFRFPVNRHLFVRNTSDILAITCQVSRPSFTAEKAARKDETSPDTFVATQKEHENRQGPSGWYEAATEQLGTPMHFS